MYDGLLSFEDCADIGDGWNWGPAANDLVVSSRGCWCEVALEGNGICLATLVLRAHLMLPARFHFNSMVRSNEWTETTIESRITLRAGRDVVEVEITVDNTAEDHRLRVLFPTGADALTCLADGPFDVFERSIALCDRNHRARELEVDGKPQQTCTAVSDKRRGLVVVSSGMMESAVVDAPQHPIALTLLRSTRRTVGTSGEPDGLLRGKHTFHLPLVPLRGAVDCVDLGQLGARLAAGLRMAQLTAGDVGMLRPERILPAGQSLLQVEGDALVRSFRQVDGALELRIYNPCETAVDGRLLIPAGSPLASCRMVERVDFESRPLGNAEPLLGAELPSPCVPRRSPHSACGSASLSLAFLSGHTLVSEEC
jgi:alpha-mannosidase/mannosylglycerate hydrolase